MADENARRAATIDWINANLKPRAGDPVECLYDRMESQSCECLPVIYEPFDGKKRAHFTDRAQILDYLAVAGTGRILDFGPGDGWPSLLLAPFVGEVVGVDASAKRVAVCVENARRLAVENASFLRVPAGEPLPFADNEFNGICAASSIEHTPDIPRTLSELCRVLKPGGKLRMHYESLDPYRGGKEFELWTSVDPDGSRLLLYDRDIGGERVAHYSIVVSLAPEEVRRLAPSAADLSPETLEELSGSVLDCATWTTRHPSCATFILLLKGAGFGSAKPTQDGGAFARNLFDRVDEAKIPADMAEVDATLKPMVAAITEVEVPPLAPAGGYGPYLTAVK